MFYSVCQKDQRQSTGIKAACGTLMKLTPGLPVRTFKRKKTLEWQLLGSI